MAQVSKINLGGIDYDVRDKVLEKEVEKIQPIINQGTINNAADEEDITSVGNLLKLKDRIATNGMGYVILRKNKTFAEQVTETNTIYEVRYDFDLNGKNVAIPSGCVLKFDGGMLKNGDLVLSDTNSIISNTEQIFSSVLLKGEIRNTDQIRTSWFGGLSQCLESIQKLYNGNNLQIDVVVDTKENISETIVIKRGKMKLTFLKDVTTTINDGTAILDIDSTTSDNISFLTIVDFKVNYAYPETQNIQNCIGIKLTGGNQYVSIIRPRIYYVETGILFAANPSSYLSKVVDATIIRCNTGVHVKKAGSNWQNGLYFSFKDMSKNSIGFLAEHGGRNTLEFKCSEVGSNDIGIKIQGGYYELIGTQWNENSITSALVVENGACVRLTGNSGINNTDKIVVADEAALYEDKGQEMYPVRAVIDQRNISSAIRFKDGYVYEIVSGAKLPIIKGETEKRGDFGESFIYNLPSAGYIHDGYIDVIPFMMRNGVSVIQKGFAEAFNKSAGIVIEFTNNKSISVGDALRYRVILYLLKTYTAIRIFKGSTEIASITNTRAPIKRLGQVTHAIVFNHLSYYDIYYREIINLNVDAEYVDALKDIEFKYMRIEGTAISDISETMHVNSIDVFSGNTSASMLRHIAENNINIISNIKTIGASTDRPDASKVGVGFQYFDTDLSKPIYSTGKSWIDATGASV